MRYLAATLALALLTSCEPEPVREDDPLAAARELAEFGKLASRQHPELALTGRLLTKGRTGPPELTFEASYVPGKQTLIYQLNNGENTERFVVGPESAVFSRKGEPDQPVNRDSVMPNGKDWPYASRLVAPFLDAIDGYAATLHSFKIHPADPPAGIGNADQLRWFQLEIDKQNAHDLLLFEFNKVTELKIGIDPASGLLKSVVSLHKDPAIPQTEIRCN